MKRRFPLLSLISSVIPLVIGFGSYPLWLWAFNHDPSGKAGMFIVIAAITCATLTASVGAVFGAILACVAHCRRERFVFIRALSFVGNLGLAGYGIFLWFSLPRA